MRANHTGELPLELIRMKAKGCEVFLFGNKGFTLPSNIGELGDDITELDLSECSLRGTGAPGIPRTRSELNESRVQDPSRSSSFAGSSSKGATLS